MGDRDIDSESFSQLHGIMALTYGTLWNISITDHDQEINSTIDTKQIMGKRTTLKNRSIAISILLHKNRYFDRSIFLMPFFSPLSGEYPFLNSSLDRDRLSRYRI